ncbi:MAG: protein kinase [Myxococcota bacterium]|nr:protein kinase [Myxococcota bacterium]
MDKEYSPGDVLLDRYKIEAVIGAGGMSVVFRCMDQRLDVVVAVKLLRSQFRQQSDVVARFLREAKLQAKLVHPNIVHVTNVEDGELTLMVMEYMRGMSLGDYSKAKGPLSETETIELIIPVVDALAMAHEKDIVHRDVKPSNIFLAEQGRRLVPKLIDFGVARELDASITTSATLLGTLPYMSFELVQTARNASPASDVYAIGVTLFQLLSHRLPVEAKTLQEYVFALMESNEPPSIKRYHAAVSDELAQVISKCLKKDPLQRYTSCGKLLEVLRALPPDRSLAPALNINPTVNLADDASLAELLTAPQPPPLPPTATQSRRLAGHYQVDGRLGEGPVAHVFSGSDSREQRFFVKVLKPAFASQSLWSSSFLEAAERQRDLAQQTPFVQPIAALHDDASLFAAPYQRLETLAHMLDSYQRFNVGYALELFILLSDGLRAAHQCGLLHRHVYPGNIALVTQSDGILTPQWLDFNHLFPLDDPELLGESLPYLPPETDGKLSNCTQASDIFGLGLCLLRCIVGQLPYAPKNLKEWRLAIDAGGIPDARTFLPELPDALCQVIAWCVNFDPKQRYQRAEEVHRDLLTVRKHVAGY